MKKLFALSLAFFVPLISIAAEEKKIASESRDAAAAYMGTMHFIVGRMAYDCFGLLTRADTPKGFVSQWQKRNNPFYDAANIYMNERLAETEKLSGREARDKVAADYDASIRQNGMAAIEDFSRNGDKYEVCRRIITLIEIGAFDVNTKTASYGELEALVEFVGKR